MRDLKTRILENQDSHDVACTESLARKANAGDMAGACAELSRWTRAGGR